MPPCTAAVVIKAVKVGRSGTRLKNYAALTKQSEVNKDADCCGFTSLTQTAKRYILFANAVCFVVHFSMVWVTVYFHHWSARGEKNLKLSVYRIQVNYSFTDETMSDGSRPDPQNYEYSLVDNGMPVDIGVICCTFYGLSAGFHLLALIMGLCPSLSYYYWYQMEAAFCWW